MSDRIVLSNMVFMGRHGVHDAERESAQPFEVDVELHLDLAAAGREDDLRRTVDYSRVFEATRAVIEGPSRLLLEALAETIAATAIAESDLVDEVVVRVRKPQVQLPGRLDWSGVEIRRRRPA